MSFRMLMLAALLALHLPLSAQLFQIKGNVVNIPHTLAGMQQSLLIDLDAKLLSQAKGQDLHVVTLIIPVPGAGGQQFPGSVFTEKGFPGTIFAGKGEALVMDWLKQGGVKLAPIAVALSQPLAPQDPPQRMTYAEKIPDGLNQDLGIQWPNRVGTPKTLLVPAKQLSRDLIGQQAPKGSEFAVVSLIIGKNLPEPPPVMLVFF